MTINERNAQALAMQIQGLVERIGNLENQLALANREIALLKVSDQESEVDKLAALVANYGSGPTA